MKNEAVQKSKDRDVDELELLPSEQYLIKCLRAGEPCIFDKDALISGRTLRGDILGKILRSEEIAGVAPFPQPRKVNIWGAFITDTLDMSDTDTSLVLQIKHSKFDAPVDFTRANLALLSFEHSDLVGAHMEYLQTDSHLWFDDVHNTGELRLSSAQIGGQFSAVSHKRQVRLSNKDGYAIAMQGAKIGSDVILHDAKIEGMVDVNGAEIKGQFAAVEASFINRDNKTIHAQGAKIDGGVFLRKTKIEGMVDVNGAEIAGQFSAVGASFINPDKTAVHAQNAKIGSDVFLSNAKIEGMADFNSAEIAGQLSAEGASFINPESDALFLQDAKIEGSLWLSGLPHPMIGSLDITNAVISAVIIDDNSYPLGRLYLDATRYDNLYRSGGVAHSICEGWLTQLSYRLRLEALTALRNNFWKEVESQVKSSGQKMTDLSNSQRTEIENLEKSTMASISDLTKPHGYWPAFAALCESFAKDGDYYLSEAELQEKARNAIDKLIHKGLNRTRSPFAYRQFAKVLDTNGHEREAREVRVLAGNEYTKRFLEDLKFPWHGLYRFWQFLILHLTAYGTRPWQVFPWLIAAWIFGGLIFWNFQDHMTPAREKYYMAVADKQDDPLAKYELGDPLPEGHPEFSPAIYALDTMLPIIDIAQENHWRPKSIPRNEASWKNQNWLLYFNRFYLLLGWFLSTIGLAGFTGLISDKREPS